MSNCCICYPQIANCSTTPKKPKCPNGNCLYLPHLLVGQNNSVGPCNETGFIPFEDVGIDTKLCGNITPTYFIQSFSNVFSAVSITSSGVTFTTNEDSHDSFGIIHYAVRCGGYTTISTITVVIKNLCAGVLCPNDQLCQRCTGNCVPSTSDYGADKPEIPTEENTSGFII